MYVEPIYLDEPQLGGSFVKRCALVTFRAIRSFGGYVTELPNPLLKAAADIRDAWEESSRPNS
jgi:hypothetical protein